MEEKPIRLWTVRYFFRNGPEKDMQMGPAWSIESKIRPTRQLFTTFSEADYYCTVEEDTGEDDGF